MEEKTQDKALNPSVEGRIRLGKGRERAFRRKTPWVFEGAVEQVEGNPRMGSVVDILSHEGIWIGRGLWNPESDIIARIYTWDESVSLDDDFWRRRVADAVRLRKQFCDSAETNAYRVIYAKADGLSGLIADRYGDIIVLHMHNSALLSRLGILSDALKAECGVSRVVWRAEQEKPNAAPTLLPLSGGDSVEEPAIILENGFRYEVDVSIGQKTGFYLDQRDNRLRVARYAAGRDILSAYCYTGAFEVAAAHAGAKSITGWDASAAALDQARRHHEFNRSPIEVQYELADVPKRLRVARDRRETWDCIILDPPRLVSTRSGLERGMRAYKDINLLAIKLLRPGGILATFSCSGWVSMEDFSRMLGFAAHDANRQVRIIETLGQPADHPIPVELPECAYLKGLICVVD